MATRPEGDMRLQGTAKRLVVYCGESDRHDHRSLARAIVERARDEGLAGATVLRGIEGFGTSAHLHTARLLSLSDDLPIVVEIVDRPERIDAFVPLVDEMMQGGLITVEDLDVHAYRPRPRYPLDDEPVS